MEDWTATLCERLQERDESEKRLKPIIDSCTFPFVLYFPMDYTGSSLAVLTNSSSSGIAAGH
jgi:hypothetical protein